MITVNKELAREVVDEMGRLAESSPTNKYSFIKFCDDNNLFNDKDKNLNAGDLFICCPFHTDESPSLGINLDKRVWHCLSCNRHNVHGGYGSFIDFVVEYKNEIEGAETTYYQQINEFLKADPVLQNKVGASSIYRQEKPQDAFRGAAFKKFKIQYSKPKTYPELATYMKNNKFDKDMIIFALLQMQTGIPPELIYDSIRSGKATIINTEISNETKQVSSDYDIDDIMSIDELQT